MNSSGEVLVNKGKNYIIKTSFGNFGRHAIKTHFIQIGEDYCDLIEKYVKPNAYGNDIVAISSKIISICQRNIIFKSDMKISILASFLSKFASTSDAGIGVNNVYKMQYAINTCGRWKVIYASIIHGISKIFFKKKGVFYDITGEHIRGLDGFYGKSFAEYEDFGICLPKDSDKVCNEIYEKTGLSCVITDTNDFTCTILGRSKTVKYDNCQLEEILKDNPFGQSNQTTPFILFRKIADDNISLERFLMLFAGDPSGASVFGLINTNNSSFPEKYRVSCIQPASFWADIWRKRDPDNIFNRRIKRIIVMPVNTDIDKLGENSNNYEVHIDIEKGSYFCDITGKTVLPVIHIILDNEEDTV